MVLAPASSVHNHVLDIYNNSYQTTKTTLRTLITGKRKSFDVNALRFEII